LRMVWRKFPSRKGQDNNVNRKRGLIKTSRDVYNKTGGHGGALKIAEARDHTLNKNDLKGKKKRRNWKRLRDQRGTYLVKLPSGQGTECHNGNLRRTRRTIRRGLKT